jgi:glucosamine--fructose-6-phosphate aminotransferase (isomerizing)
LSSEKNAQALGLVTEAEIATQPDYWQKAYKMGRSVHKGMPTAEESVLLMGCGTSYYIAAAYAALRNLQGLGETDAVIASDYRPTSRKYDRVIAISRSGTSLDLIEAIARIVDGTPVTVILGETGTPLEALATDIIDFSFADEQSVVQTRFPTSLLTFFRAQLGLSDLEFDALFSSVKETLERDLLHQPVKQLVILGSHWASFLAEEAALKCRESAGIWVESYSTAEFRHGPISVAGEGSLVWALSELSDDEITAIKSTGATLHQSSNDPQVELAYIQRHAVEWARQAGRDADNPQYLSRSVK